MNRFLVILTILFAAAFALCLRTVIVQRNIIAELQALRPIYRNASAEESAVDGEERPKPIPVLEPITPAFTNPPSSSAAQTELGQLKMENVKLHGLVTELAQDADQSRRLVQMSENLRAAYVGPGTWIKNLSDSHFSNGEEAFLGISKVVISGEFPKRVIDGKRVATDYRFPLEVEAWEKCRTGECALGKVPFFLTDWDIAGITYRRGLAAWVINGQTRYMLMTFHEDGLHIEWFDTKDGRRRSWGTYRMDRVQ